MPPPVDEAAQTEAWQIARLLELGFTLPQATLLAAAGVEWWSAKRLIDGGCDVDRAFDILV